MKIQEILDSIYIIPIILEHLDTPTEATQAVLDEQNINFETIKECLKIRGLLEYHQDMITNDYKDNYHTLRAGLKQYWKQYLVTIFEKAGITDRSGLMIDYGCGSGQVADSFKYYNPKCLTMLIDKVSSRDDITAIDFENEPDWYKPYLRSASYVILSEVLHCKSTLIQRYLIDSSFNMIENNGTLIIIENVDYIMAYRIGKIKKTEQKIIDRITVKELIKDKFTIKKITVINRHNLYECTKI